MDSGDPSSQTIFPTLMKLIRPDIIAHRLRQTLLVGGLGLFSLPVFAAQDTDKDLPRPQMYTPTPEPRPGFALGPAQTTEFRSPAGWTLYGRVPLAWSAEGTPGPDRGVIVLIQPKVGRSFSLQLAAVQLTPAESARLHGEAFREVVRKDGERLLPNAKETSIRPEHLLGEAGEGYIYTLTDPRSNLPSGEWRYHVAGAYVTGNKLVSISMLTNETTGVIRMQVLDLLRSLMADDGR